MSDITIEAGDGGSFTGYLAKPSSGVGAGVLVIQEIFGVNEVMRDLCDGFARAGYFALCPDLFWRQQPGIRITDRTEAEWAKAFELYKGFDVAKGVADLQASLAALRRMPGCTGKVGSVGYCLGGKLAYLMATRSDADCNVSYYGVAIEADLAEASRITRPLMLHIAEKDQFVPAPAQAQIKAALGADPRVTIHVYPGMDHAFARVGGQHFDETSAKSADARTTAFFRRHLG
jgi:carboxymethylenebutenolidase